MKNILFILTLMIFVLSACGTPVTPVPIPTNTLAPVPTETPVPPTATLEPSPTYTPEPTPTLEFAIPTPVTGTGTIAGLVLWNKEPVAKAAVKMCEEYDIVTGCLGKQYSINTNKQGYFIFQNIKPSNYVILINIDSTSWWSYQTVDGLPIPAEDTAYPGQITYVDPREIYKVDLKIIQPVLGAKVTKKQPTIKWEEYAGAAYYTIHIEDYEGGEFIAKSNSNEYILEKPLMDCDYYLTVTAYNDENSKISENPSEYPDYYTFTVDNEPLVSCNMTILFPPWDSYQKGTNIELSWEAHPYAAYYEILIENGRSETILNYTRIEKDHSSYTITLPPGKYIWNVDAYDEDGKMLVYNIGRFYVK